MNIFYLDGNYRKAAEMHCDKHCVKMILEYAQMLSSAHHLLDEEYVISNDLYKVAHKNHPCTIWVRENAQHYLWLYSLFQYLSEEYTKRYGKIHASWKKLHKHLKHLPKNIKHIKWRTPPQCMPDNCKHDNTVEAYRNYYILEKNKIAKWKYTEQPQWFTKGMYRANI